MKFSIVFLLVVALSFGGLTRCAVGNDLEVIAKDDGANLASPGETLDNDNDSGTDKIPALFFETCPFYDPCIAVFFLTLWSMGEEHFSRECLEIYQLNRALLI